MDAIGYLQEAAQRADELSSDPDRPYYMELRLMEEGVRVDVYGGGSSAKPLVPWTIIRAATVNPIVLAMDKAVREVLRTVAEAQ